MSHANAALTPRARLRLARLIVEDGWSPTVAAEMFLVWPVTARKWAARYRLEGVSGMADRSSRPRSCPHRTPDAVVRKIVALRWRQRLGPVQIGGELGMPASTVHAVLVRCRINRLSRTDRAQVSRSGVMSTTIPARCFTSMSPSSATSPTAAATASSAVSRGSGISERRPDCPGEGITNREPAPPSYIPSSTTTPELHTSRSALMNEPRQPSRFCTEQWRGSASAESLSSAFSPTTEPATAPSPGAMPAPHSASPPNAPGPTARRPTARSNASTAPWLTAGPTPASTAQRPSVEPRSRPGSTSTITTGSTPPSAAHRQQAQQPAWTSHLALSPSHR
jgi:hypothetical protein